MRIFIFIIGFLTVFAILGAMSFTRWAENQMIFYPEARLERVPPEWGLVHRDVFFEAEDGVRLHGWLFPLEGDRPVLLFSHGNAGNISHRLDNVRLLLNEGLQVFIFDYRGYGRSAGKPSEEGIYKDGLAAYDFLSEKEGFSSRTIIPFGRSLGACVALEIALRRSVRAIILESAFTNTKEMAASIPLFKPFSYLLPAHYNNLAKIGKVSVPKLLVHGTDDEIVPFSMGQELFDAAKEPKRFFPLQGAGHNDTYLVGGSAYFRALKDFALQPLAALP
mgnify:CR=1 FL=1